MRRVLFNFDQVEKLSRQFQKMNNLPEASEYEQGISDGIEFVFFLFERMEE